MNGKQVLIQRQDVFCSEVKISQYQKSGTMTAQLRQVITTNTTYPSVQISDGISDTLFGSQDFNLPTGKSFANDSTRVYFMNVPTHVNGQPMNVQLVNKMLGDLKAQGKQITLQKVISNSPILTAGQESAIANPSINKTKADFAESQAVRYPKQHAQAGQLVLDSEGNVMYRRIFFFDKIVEDVNNCNGNSEIYISPKLEAELNPSTVANQVLSFDNKLDF